MSINLEEQITYQLQVGTSLQPKDTDSKGNSDEFHLVSRHLPRTTTKLARETLENGRNPRVRIPSARDTDKWPLLLEAESPDLKSTYTYEGEFEMISKSDEDEDDDGVACVLIYDDEVKAFTVERLCSMPAVRSGVPNSVAAANTSAGMLALPTNTHDKAKEKTAARRESESVMDEALEDELAKELEGMLDDDSDDGRSRRNSKSLEKRVNSEDQLNAELVESLDEALLDANGSDEDEFEEVDESEVLAARRESSRLTNDKSDRRSTADFDDEDEMIFEEVDPPAELGPVESIEEDSDQFEEVDGSRVNSMADDSLFSGSYTASPMSYIDQPSSSHQQTKKPSSLDTVDDEFEDLDLDLARSLDSS